MNPKLREVFGVRAEPVLSYIERQDVDDRFISGLKTDKQIIVYGASKQGKTSLVTKHLSYDKNIVIRVGPKTDIEDIYKSILRQVGIKILSESDKTAHSESALTIGAKVKALIPLFGGGEATAEGEIKAGGTTKDTYEEVSFNLSVPQDISELLRRTGAKQSIILENFHYLDDVRQKQLAFDLRTFQELGIRFVILGVWREKNRLAQFNGDLLDRVVEIPVEPWSRGDFMKVAERGGQHLKIEFADYILDAAVNASFNSVGVFQELLRETCAHAGIEEAQPTTVRVENQLYLEKAVKKKADDYASRHQRVLEAMAAGNIGTSGSKDGLQSLCLPYYLVKSILSKGYDGLANGMLRASIQDQIQAIHHRPQDVRASDMSNLLHNLGTMQSNKGISPPIFDYDRLTRQLQVVDSTFYFFLKNADLKQISDELSSPLDN
jgi:hypothetical protein